MKEEAKAYEEAIRADERKKFHKEIVSVLAGLDAVRDKIQKWIWFKAMASPSDGTNAKASNREAATTLSAQEEVDLDRAILGRLSYEGEKGGGPWRCGAIATFISWEPAHVSRALARLVKQGKVIATGARRAKRYSLALQGDPASLRDGQFAEVEEKESNG